MKKILPVLLTSFLAHIPASQLQSASATWSGAVDGIWTTAGNWMSSVPGSSTVATTNNDTATFGNNVNPSISVDPTRSLGSLVFNAGAGAFTFNSGTFYLSAPGGVGTATGIVLESGVTANQTFNSSLQGLRFSAGGGFGFTNHSTEADLIINGGVRGSTGAGSAAMQLNLDGAGDGFINGVISDGLGALSVSKTGRGTWTFANASTYTGATTLADGKITLDFTQTASPSANIVSSSSSLVLGRPSPSILAGARTLAVVGKADAANVQTFNGFTLNAGANHIDLSTAGTGSLVVDLGAMSTTGRTAGTTLDIKTPASTSVTTTAANTAAGILPQVVTLNGTDFASNNGSNTIVAFAGYTANTATALGTANQVIDMTGGNTALAGTGQTGIAGMRFNTPGATTLALDTGRMVAIGNSGAILVTENVGASLSLISGGLLAGISARDLVILQNNTGGDLQIDSVVTSANNNPLGLTKSGAGRLILTGNNTYGGNAASYLNEGTVVVTANATTGNTQTLTTTASNTLTGVDTAGLFVGQRVTGDGISSTNQGFYITAIDHDAGTVTLSLATTAGSGNVTFGNSGGLGTTTGAAAVQIGAGASLEIGNGGTTGGLVEGQGIINHGKVSLNRSNSLTFSNTMTGSGEFQQIGTGTSALAGVHTYTGETRVNSGTLLINGSAAFSEAEVNSGGALGGAGTIGGIVLNAGGALTPGNSIGTLSTNNGDLVWNGQADGSFLQMKFELDSLSDASDLLNLGTGTFDRGTGSVFAFDFLGTGAEGFTYTLVTFGLTDFVSGDFTYSNLAAGLTGSFVLNSGSLQFQVSAIPEPSTCLFLAAGLGVAFFSRRRTRN